MIDLKPQQSIELNLNLDIVYPEGESAPESDS